MELLLLTFIQKEEKIPYFTISSYLYDASLYIMHGVAIDGFFFLPKTDFLSIKERNHPEKNICF